MQKVVQTMLCIANINSIFWKVVLHKESLYLLLKVEVFPMWDHIEIERANSCLNYTLLKRVEKSPFSNGIVVYDTVQVHFMNYLEN